MTFPAGFPVAADTTGASAATVDTAKWPVLVDRNGGKALKVYNFGTAKGPSVVQWPRTDAADQQWRFLGSGNGWYRLLHRTIGRRPGGS